MSSAAQFAANQANARLSTGPISENGKAISSHNNLRHGFRSQTVLLPGDDPAAYEALLADLTEYYAPQELIETRFVREMTDADWRLRRLREHLESAITRHMAKLASTYPDASALELQSLAIETLSETGTSYGTWLRYETKFERQYDRAFKDRTRYQELRRNTIIKETDLAMKKVLFASMPEELASNVQNPQSTPPPTGESASNVQSAPQPAPKLASNVQIVRNAPCSCGSRLKYKRCCGKSAPPVPGDDLAKAA
jgi:SEC-C motif